MAQVVVYGPNGARTTANTERRPGEEKSEYERLIAGEIPGREGYKGATQQEPLTPDYPGDYGGEDASTPMDQRESVVGVGNTGYDPKDYSDVGPDGEVVIKNPDGSVYTGIDKRDMPIPTGAEFWNVNDNYYIAYYIPGTGTPIYYDTSLSDLENIFGPVEFPGVKESIITPTTAQWNGAIRFGDSLELADRTIYPSEQNPWISFVDTVAKEAKIRPWLNDEEMILLLAEATLEGRTVTDAEWQGTNWWRTHTQEERDWLLLAQSASTDFSGSLPADAQRKIEDDRLAIENLMVQSGISNPSEELVNWVAQKFTTGLWSEAYTSDQITILADPTMEAEIDSDLNNFITSGEIDYDTTRAGESQVKRLVKEYLGPVFGGNIADSQINKWASMIRNDPDAEINIKDTLLNMKKGLFPGFNDELTYEEIAAPWRGFSTNTWGGTVDETSTLFQDIVKSNDVAKATTLLYNAGLKDGGSEKIKNEVLSSMVGKFGAGGVRRIV